MRAKIRKWGNSLALRIPKAFAQDAKLENDTTVELALVEGQIVIKPISPPQWSLEELLSEVTSDNLHQEVDPGEAVGNEVW